MKSAGALLTSLGAGCHLLRGMQVISWQLFQESLTRSAPPPPPLLPPPQACGVAFDRDDELFAPVGVSRRIKVFDFKACMSATGVVTYPALQVRRQRSTTGSSCRMQQ